MEEVDLIIVHTLRQLGCEFENEVSSIRDFTTENVVEGVVRCLKFICPNVDLPTHVPPSMAARYRLGSMLANTCSDLGYNGEIGYQTFLYSNENELRRLFVFLIEKLPKESEKVIDEPLDKATLIRRALVNETAALSKLPWTPRYCKKKGIHWRSNTQWSREGYADVRPYHSYQLSVPDSRKTSIAHQAYYNNHLPFIFDQLPKKHDMYASILEANALSISASREWENEWSHAGASTQLSEQEYKEQKKARIQKRIGDYLHQAQQSLKSSEGTTATLDLQKLLLTLDKEQSSTQRAKSSRFAHTEKLQFTQEKEKLVEPPGLRLEAKPKDSEESLKQQRQDEIDALERDLTETVQNMEKLTLDVKKHNSSVQQMMEQISKLQETSSDLEQQYLVRKKTFDLLPDADNNLKKLQAVVDSSSQRLVILASQWEKHRLPLIEEYRRLKEISSQKLNDTQRRLEEIKSMREKMREVVEEAKNKEELLKPLVGLFQQKLDCLHREKSKLLEYEKLTKDISRTAYTRRILEIVSNIKKQNAEIEKVLIDTRTIQKEINQLSGKLDRTFTVTDELIFRDAKKDESVRRAYKFLAALHENCSILIQTVEETGAIMREIRELEDQCEQEKQKKVAANLERITADYKQMKQENAALMAQLKG